MGRAIISLLRLRQLQLGRHPDYLVNSYADANRCTDSSSTKTQSSKFLQPVYSVWPEVGGAVRGVTDRNSLAHFPQGGGER